jgi:hypothetical protein
MAYIANLQRQTYEEPLVKGNFPINIATFQINKPNIGGGEHPCSLFKIQSNWYSGSYIVNSELYINQVILTPITSSPEPYYIPDGETGPSDSNFPITGSTNASKYSHLLFSDQTRISDYFKISFANFRDDPDDGSYYLIDVIITTPDYDNGNLMADSSCYILNTI